jgi:hypothetical protein
LQRGTLGVRQERYGEAELHRVAPNRNRREGDIQLSGSRAAGEINTVRNSRVLGSASSALTMDTATTSSPKIAADAPVLAMKKLS